MAKKTCFLSFVEDFLETFKIEQICRTVMSSIEEEMFLYYHTLRTKSCIVQVRSLKQINEVKMNISYAIIDTAENIWMKSLPTHESGLWIAHFFE